jgi:hypothetical protein
MRPRIQTRLVLVGVDEKGRARRLAAAILIPCLGRFESHRHASEQPACRHDGRHTAWSIVVGAGGQDAILCRHAVSRGRLPAGQLLHALLDLRPERLLGRLLALLVDHRDVALEIDLTDVVGTDLRRLVVTFRVLDVCCGQPMLE